MPLLSAEQDRLLDPPGFYAQWLVFVSQGFTHEKAYEFTEAMYQAIRPRPAYSDFSSFYRQARRYKQRTKKNDRTV